MSKIPSWWKLLYDKIELVEFSKISMKIKFILSEAEVLFVIQTYPGFGWSGIFVYVKHKIKDHAHRP